MNSFGKIVSFLLIITILLFAGAAAFVHFYLTDEKIKELVIPQAEKALGRTVSIGDIDVGIFSGITIDNFVVKERDKQTNFLETERFILSYNLLPLLKKKLIISEILLDKPSVKVIRDKDGNFNFNTLAFFALVAQKAEKPTAPTTSTATKTAMPLALTIESIRVNEASLSFSDHKKELPDSDATANIKVAIDMGMDMTTIKFAGEMDCTASAQYHEITLQAQVNSSFNQEQLTYKVDLDIDKEKVILDGKISQFMTPNIVFNLSSQKLNLDHLMALSAALPKAASVSAKAVQTEAEPAKKAKGDKIAIASSLPKGLHAEGKISIQQATYKKLPINNFLLEHDLSNGIFTIKDLSAKTAGGSLSSKMEIDLNKADPQYNGSMSLDSIELSSLGAGLEQGFADIVSGALQSTLTFEGAGITPETIKKSLSADASYTVSNGQFKNTSVTKSIASLTGLSELEEVSFQDMTGTVKLLKGGILQLASAISAKDFSADTKGTVDLDGQIDMPIIVKLSDTLSKKLDTKGSLTKFLANDKGETELRLKVAGLISSPKTTLDSAGVQEQVKNTLKTKAMGELNRLMNKQETSPPQEGGQQNEPPSLNEPAANLIKGLFGR